MNHYLSLLSEVVQNGRYTEDRTGIGCYSVFGRQIRFNLRDGFPLLTTKRIAFRWVAEELFFFLRGDTNRKTLNEKSVTIWDEWGDENGNLGPIYSHQWRNFGGKHENRPQPKPPSFEDQTIFGVASKGSYSKGSDAITDKLFITWKGMIARCYNSKKDTYRYYGGRGVFVHNSWLRFDIFNSDVRNLDGWPQKVGDWDAYFLDKDIAGDGFCYGPKTCLWATRSENCRAKSRSSLILRHSDGRIEEGPSSIVLRERLGIKNQGNFDAMLRGERPSSEGWTLLDSLDLTRGVDQIKNLMNDLEITPNSRRLVVSAWNPSDTKYMALPACHTLYQLHVDPDNALSLQLYMRSADIFLGVPFNIASYALLLSLIAFTTGREPADLVISFGNLHLYSNHQEQAKLQLSRTPYSLPTLKIDQKLWNSGLSGLLGATYNDIKLQNYIHHPKIEAPVAV